MVKYSHPHSIFFLFCMHVEEELFCIFTELFQDHNYKCHECCSLNTTDDMPKHVFSERCQGDLESLRKMENYPVCFVGQ